MYPVFGKKWRGPLRVSLMVDEGQYSSWSKAVNYIFISSPAAITLASSTGCTSLSKGRPSCPSTAFRLQVLNQPSATTNRCRFQGPDRDDPSRPPAAIMGGLGPANRTQLMVMYPFFGKEVEESIFASLLMVDRQCFPRSLTVMTPARPPTAISSGPGPAKQPHQMVMMPDLFRYKHNLGVGHHEPPPGDD